MTVKKITCDKHGMDRAAFICQHLNKYEYVGFHEYFPSDPNDTEEEEECQAWCDKCEIVRQKTDGWNDESMEFADIKLICNGCYFEIKNFQLNK